MIQGIILAAGLSQRFGSQKLMHPMADGSPMAVASARNLVAALPGCLAVVRHEEDELSALLTQAGCRVIVNTLANQGMGTSLACGVNASPNAAGWVIALADMPFIPPAIIRSVAEQIKTERVICAPQYQQQRGHPVGFSATYGAELGKLARNDGARHLIHQHAGWLKTLSVDDAGVLLDIDEIDDLKRVHAIKNKNDILVD